MTDPLALQTIPGSPARMTASATVKLPRWVLLVLCLFYILPGLVGRDPWKTEDATGFGIMWTMAEGRGFGGITDWLIPNVAGAPVYDSGPLMYWVGALCIKLFGWLLGAPHAARVANIIGFLLATGGIWYGTYLLGRRKAMQPLALAFGGQPDPRDYGRVLADGAMLILMGTIGFLQRSHESSSDVAVLAMLGMALYAAARSLDRAKLGALWMALALAGLGLSDAQGAMFTMLILWLALVLFHPEWKLSRWPFLTLTLPVTLFLLILWPLFIYTFVPDAMAYFGTRWLMWKSYFDGISVTALQKYAKALPWYTWLAWPIMLWSIWSWRRQLKAAHMVLPCGYIIVFLALLMTTSDTSDGQLLMVLPGVVMLAAFGLPTLRRGTANAIDWFSLLVYSLIAFVLWFSWVTLMTGSPEAWNRSISRQTPGFTPEFHPFIFLFAALATAGWFWLVHWRIVKHPKVLWRSVVLSSGGLVLTWVLANSLFLNSINYSRTYRDVATQISDRMVNAKGCVDSDGLGLAQRASFAYFADLHFASENQSILKNSVCNYLLRQDTVPQKRADKLPPGHWSLIWEGRRASDRSERFRLYRRMTLAEAMAE